MKFDQIELHHLKKAADDFDEIGMPPTFQTASFYDAVFEGKTYPPKALIALAQQSATGSLPTSNQFKGGENTACFKTLKKLGVTIQPKADWSMYKLLIEFLEHAQSGDQKFGKFNKKFQGLTTKASFGMGKSATIPWLGIRDNEFQKERGTDCVFLYFKEQQHLALVYAHWESVDSKKWAWPESIIGGRQSVAEHFTDRFQSKPYRYRDSYVFKSYQVSLKGSDIALVHPNGEEISEDQVNADVDQIVDEYKAVIESSKTRSPVGRQILSQYLEWYKELIDPQSPFDPIKQTRKSNEGYKWKAFECFQNNWNDNHTDQNILDIISKSFADGNNLVRGPHYFPVGMLKGFAEIAPERTSQMFHRLYDDQEPIDARVLGFMEEADKLLELAQGETFDWNGRKPVNHYQKKRPIAVYLAMRFPESYFLFKKKMITDFCDNTLFWPKDKFGRTKSRDLSDLLEFFDLCEEAKTLVANDKELHKLNLARLKAENIEDVSFDDTNLLTQDFIYSVTEYLTPTPDLDKELIDILRKFGQDDCLKLIELIKRSLDALGLDPSDERIAFSMPKDGSFLGLNIGQRRAVGIDMSDDRKQYVLFDSVEGEASTEKGEDWRILRYDTMDEMISNHSVFLEFAQKYLPNVTVSGYHDNAPKALVRAFCDDGYLKVILLKAFNEQFNGSNTKSISNAGSLPKPQNSMTSFDLNQIFFGPPGTGKTFNTINAALEIVDPEFLKTHKDDRAALVRRFKELQLTETNSGGQIAFTTFHQSLSYEDFIEGIKPNLDGDQASMLSYKIEDGIFKQLCDSAISGTGHMNGNHQGFMSQREFDHQSIYKISLGNTSKSDESVIYSYCIENNCIGIGYGEGIDLSGKSSSEIQELCMQHGLNQSHWTTTNMLYNKMNLGDYFLVSDGNRSFRAIGRITGPGRFVEESPFANHPTFQHFRDVEWIHIDQKIPSKLASRKEVSQLSLYELDKKNLVQEFFVTSSNRESSPEKNFVLVIDEINRGNVSSIFGELITLIEKDKRQGQENELQATLPYSKESFSVPSNVYIIGTMNTADRSVEALDSALRRRFSFKEMPPQPDLIRSVGKLKASNGCLPDGTDLCEILKAINSRLLVLLDKDHLIGHSYFLNAANKEDLKTLFEDKVLPLLEEYFFGDYGKIGLVLGKSFVAKTSKNTQLLGDGYYVLRDDLKHREDFELQEKKDWDFKAIYKQ